MTKEQFIKKWGYRFAPPLIADLDAVIATEIAKAQEVKLEDAKPQPAINPIAEAYERGEKVKRKSWGKHEWIQKLSETESTSDTLTTFANNWNFTTHPEKWELYTEPTDQVTDQVTDHVAEPAEQPISQAKLDNSFDKERFERMFCASIGIGKFASFSDIILSVETTLQKLDAYYAEKGGNNE